ncbi:response regulator, partial [Aureobasidium melanogenum]
MNSALTTPPPDLALRTGARVARGGPHGPHSAASSTSMSYGELDNLVYPVGQTNGIDPMFSEHIHNIPYAMPTKAPEPAPAPPAADGRKKSMQYDPGWARQPQVLLVEDDQTCRRIGGKFLYAFHCAVDSALDGLEAVNKMNAGAKYDLVLMDIIMPNLDGVSACHLIRQFDNTPIIAMTSNIRSDDIAMYFQHGMNDVLPKPFTKEGLLSMLEKHLGHLKKSPSQIDGVTTGAPPPLVQVAAKNALKAEESPATSPATVSNWTSPGTGLGMSPAASDAAGNEYSMGVAGHPSAPYHMQTGMPPPSMPSQVSYGGSPRGMPPGLGPQPGGPHRRQISDISGGPGDIGGDAKRQQMFGAGPMPPHMGPGKFDDLGPAVQVSFNKLKDQIQTLEQRTQALEQQTHALEQQSHTLAEQNLALQERVQAIEEENRTLRAKKFDAEDRDELSLINTTRVSESTSEDLDPELVFEVLGSKHSSRSDSTEYVPSPMHQQISTAPSTIDTGNENYTVWYENGTLTTNAPERLLSTQDWHDLLDTFAELRSFFAEKNVYWHLTNKTKACVRNVVQRSGDPSSMRWTIDSPGKFCCKRCLNTQRVCLKYNEESARLEALPLPEKVRPEGAPFGIKWFVAEQPDASRKAGFKGLWVVN